MTNDLRRHEGYQEFKEAMFRYNATLPHDQPEFPREVFLRVKNYYELTDNVLPLPKTKPGEFTRAQLEHEVHERVQKSFRANVMRGYLEGYREHDVSATAYMNDYHFLLDLAVATNDRAWYDELYPVYARLVPQAEREKAER